MNLKKLLAGVLALTVVLSMLAGCGNTKNASNSTSGDTANVSSGSSTVVASYPIQGDNKLTFWLPIQPPAAKYISNYKDQEVFQEISKRTGVNAEFIHPAVGQEKEQLGVLVAAGNLPDIIQIRGFYNGGSAAGVNEGIFADLTELVPTYAKDYYNAIRQSDEAYRLATTNDNKITEFDLLKQSAPAFTRLNFREDILDEMGYDKMPVTINDYEEIFEKMKAKGIAGFSPAKTGRVDQFMWIYGITEGFFTGADGKVKWGQGEQAYRDYLTMMNKWWKAGYLYKDFASNMTINDLRALWTSKKVGMHQEPVDLAYSLAKANKFSIAAANYPRLTDGQPIHFETVSEDILPITKPGETMATVITTSCKKPEIAVQYINYYYTQEGADLCNWGIKDKSYTVETGGKKIFTDYMLKNDKIALGDVQTMLKIHMIAKLAEPDVDCNPNVVSDPKVLELRKMYSDDKTIDNSQVLPLFQLTPEDSAKRNKIMADIDTYADEMTLKFIMGATPMSDFDKYISQLKAMNIDEAIKITQEGYDTYKSKPGIK